MFVRVLFTFFLLKYLYICSLCVITHIITLSGRPGGYPDDDLRNKKNESMVSLVSRCYMRVVNGSLVFVKEKFPACCSNISISMLI